MSIRTMSPTFRRRLFNGYSFSSRFLSSFFFPCKTKKERRKKSQGWALDVLPLRLTQNLPIIIYFIAAHKCRLDLACEFMSFKRRVPLPRLRLRRADNKRLVRV